MTSPESSACNKGLLLVCNAAEDRVQLVLGRDRDILFVQEAAGSGRTLLVLPQAMQACFQQTGVAVQDLSGLAYVRGPGTFTGLRVSIALCTGLGKGAGIPLAGLEYLPLIAFGAAFGSTEVWVCTHARKGLVYVQGFTASGQSLSPLAVSALEDAAKRLEARHKPVSLVGSGVSRQKAFWRERLPGARILERRWNHPAPTDLLLAARQAEYARQPAPPLYLRAADAEVNIPQLAAGRGLEADDFRKRIPDFLNPSGTSD
jgi:tRNA threonylcarbamoyl adenosine modification protein YeaZ